MSAWYRGELRTRLTGEQQALYLTQEKDANKKMRSHMCFELHNTDLERDVPHVELLGTPTIQILTCQRSHTRSQHYFVWWIKYV